MVFLLNVLACVFGSSYLFWPSATVLAYGGTHGLLHVPRQLWGLYTIASALAMLLIGVTGFRQGKRWAWYAAWYQIVFFAAVAAIEPDPVFPVIFAVIVLAAMAWSYRRFFPASGGGPEARAST
jgi:hypothetical protein